MCGEHDLSAYCLQDEGSSQAPGDAERSTAQDGEGESLAWAEEHHAQYGVLPGDDSHGDRAGIDGDAASRVPGYRQGGREDAATAAGAASCAKGRSGWTSDRGEDPRARGEEGGAGGHEQDGRSGGVESDGKDAWLESVYSDLGCDEAYGRMLSSLQLAGKESRRIDSAGNVESSGAGHSSPKGDPNDVNASTSCGFSASRERLAAVAEETAGKEGAGRAAASHTCTKVSHPGNNSNSNNRPRKSSILGHVRGTSKFFPTTNEDDEDFGSTREPRGERNFVTPTAAKATRKGHLSGYGGDGLSRRRSSGVNEEIFTAGARALAEAASMTSSAAGESNNQRFEGKMVASSDGFAHGRDEGRGGEGGQYRLGPEEATPTAGGAYAAYTTASYNGHRPHQRWPQTVIVDGEPTPRLYGENHETSRTAAEVSIDERACSPACVEGCFGPNRPRRFTLSSTSTEFPTEEGVTKPKHMHPGRCESGSVLKEGGIPPATPRHKATVADVQEAFERADTRVAWEATQSPRSDNGEGGSRRSRQLQGDDDVVGEQVSTAIGGQAGPKTCCGCIDEVEGRSGMYFHEALVAILHLLAGVAKEKGTLCCPLASTLHSAPCLHLVG